MGETKPGMPRQARVGVCAGCTPIRVLAYDHPGVRMSGHLEHLGLEISTMPSNEKEEAKISCKCGVCELTLADGKSTVSFLCGCEDCRQALQWGFKNGGVEPDPL